MVDLIQYYDGFADVVVHEMRPGFGLVCRSPLADLGWSFKISDHPGERNEVRSWNGVWWCLQGGFATRFTMLRFLMGGQGYLCQV